MTYPKKVKTYRGYVITETSGYIENKLRAEKNGDIHTRRYDKGGDRNRAVELLEKDIKRYGNH